MGRGRKRADAVHGCAPAACLLPPLSCGMFFAVRSFSQPAAPDAKSTWLLLSLAAATSAYVAQAQRPEGGSHEASLVVVTTGASNPRPLITVRRDKESSPHNQPVSHHPGVNTHKLFPFLSHLARLPTRPNPPPSGPGDPAGQVRPLRPRAGGGPGRPGRGGGAQRRRRGPLLRGGPEAWAAVRGGRVWGRGAAARGGRGHGGAGSDASFLLPQSVYR